MMTKSCPLFTVMGKIRIQMRICLEPNSHHVQMCTDMIGTLVGLELRPLPRPFHIFSVTSVFSLWIGIVFLQETVDSIPFPPSH